MNATGNTLPSTSPANATILVEAPGLARPVMRVGIASPSAVIGRAGDCAVRLEHPMVSRAHARLDFTEEGTWRLSDLGSHNGTRLNGNPVSQASLAHGDRIHIGPFALRLELASAVGTTMAGQPTDQSLLLGLSDEHRLIRTLKEIAPPQLAVEQLRCLDDFNRQMLGMADATERLVALCRLMLHPRFGGRWAVAVHVPPGTAANASDAVEAHPLCPVQNAVETASVPRLSRTLLRAVRQRREPVLATNSPNRPAGDFGGIELSIAPEISPMAAVAVPMSGDISPTADAAADINLLCAGFPPEYGTGEWLALCALAVRHYLQAEAVWANISANRKLAALEADLERARRVQDRLVPKRCDISGLDIAVRFIPCQGVAGDYVDALALPGGQALLVLADVCGKGLPAALVAMGLHTLVHSSARRWAGLDELASSIGTHLVDTLSPGSFVTFMAMTLDPASGRVEIVNGGHPAAVVVDTKGAIRRLGSEGGFPLGLMEQTLLVSQDQLGDGDTMIVFTDGCFEICDTPDHMVGADEFCMQVAAPVAVAQSSNDAADTVMFLLDKWQRGEMSTDDRTLLLVRRRKGSGAPSGTGTN